MTNPMSLEGKTILVTGAAQGIGEAVARKIVDLGGDVIILDRNEEKLGEVSASLPSGRAIHYAGSVTDPEFLADMVESAVAAKGQIDGLVNNAGIIRPALIQKMSLEDWQSVIDINLTGVHLVQQAVGRHMLGRAQKGDQGTGVILNVSSVAGKTGSFGQVNYSAAKAGVLGVTMSAAREWAVYGVRVNSIGFGIVETEMTTKIRSEEMRERSLRSVPMGRFASAEEVANPMCFLLSEASSYMTGQHLTVDGGVHISV